MIPMLGTHLMYTITCRVSSCMHELFEGTQNIKNIKVSDFNIAELAQKVMDWLVFSNINDSSSKDLG